jgi:nucleoside-diphosphate-sugar epimerase
MVNEVLKVKRTDVAEGLLRLAASPEATGCINLSSGCTRSIDDLLRILTEHLPETESLIVEHGIKDVFEASCGDLSMLKRMTGRSPLTILEKGIKLVIDHEKFKVEKE